MRKVSVRHVFSFLIVTFLSISVSGIAIADSYAARVIAITDGDTITVLVNGAQQTVIRLAGIDAPEHGQAFGTASEQHLSTLILGKNVNLDCGGEESYGRLVCKVLLPG